MLKFIMPNTAETIYCIAFLITVIALTSTNLHKTFKFPYEPDGAGKGGI